MRDLRLTDLAPGPEWGRAPSGELAAANERALQEMMLSLTFAAQARLLRSDEASASGWSPAEEMAQRAARAVNQLSLAATRLYRSYRTDIAFTDCRDAIEGERITRVDALALAAMARTDPRKPLDEETRRLRAQRREAEERATQAYVAEMAERLRRYEPDWETPEAFAARCEAALDAGQDVPPTPVPATSAAPDSAAVQNAKSEEQKISAETAPSPAAASSPTQNAKTQEQNTPPVPRRRGAPPGNRRALKTGRHTAAALAERAETRAMMRQVRALCDDATALARRAPRAKTRGNRANGHAA